MASINDIWIGPQGQRATTIDRLTVHYTAEGRVKAEKWLSDLGTKFREVWFLVGGEWIDENHVDDPETFDTTVDMSRDRLSARYVMYEFDGKWVLIGGRCGYAKDYPSRDAAEMVARHGG